MDGNDTAQTLLGKKSRLATVTPGWLTDLADLFVLLCSFLLTTASIVLVVLIFQVQANFGWDHFVPREMLILQRGISTLSVTITSAMIIVIGKRYVLFKLVREGIHSRRVATYSRPSIGNLVYHLVWHGVEFFLLALLAIWALALVTGLTVNDAWATVPTVESTPLSIPFGPFDAPRAKGELVLPASGQLSYVIASVCSGVAGNVGLINITGGPQLASGGPTGVLFYPPLPFYTPNVAFSVSTSLNGFNISAEPLSSVPPTAQNLTCVDNTGYGFSTGQLWYEGGDNQTLSIIANPPGWQSLYRLNASALIFDGTLRSTGNATEFVPDGTTRPNVMSNNRWAEDIASLVCNATIAGSCSSLNGGLSLLDFAIALNSPHYSLSLFGTDTLTAAGIYWSTVLGMAMGAYSFVSYPSIGTTIYVPATRNDILQFTPRFGAYVLIANVVVSTLMLLAVVALRMRSRLGGDFINSTRLLLDPLKNPELFNASLDTTVNALGNPYMLVREDNEFLLAEQALSHGKRRRWNAGR